MASRNPPAHPAERRPPDFARRVRRMFDRLAGVYDFGNHLLSAGLDHRWRSRTVTELDPDPGWTVLDVASGTGDLARALLKRRGVRVVAADFSLPMLRRTGAKLAGAVRAGRAAVLAADAQRLPLPDAAVDAVTCGFGLRNVADPAACVAEWVRVVRPRGRIAVLEFHRPARQGVLRRAFGLYFRRILPTLGKRLSPGGAYRYLVASIDAFGPTDEVAGRLRGAGLEDVSIRRLPGGIAAVTTGRVPGQQARASHALR